jgi:hypothetical protein
MQVFYESGVFPLRGMIGRRSAEHGSINRAQANHAQNRIERAWLLLEEVRATYRNHPNKTNRRRLADAVDRFHEAYGMPVAGRRLCAALSCDANGR